MLARSGCAARFRAAPLSNTLRPARFGLRLFKGAKVLSSDAMGGRCLWAKIFGSRVIEHYRARHITWRDKLKAGTGQVELTGGGCVAARSKNDETADEGGLLELDDFGARCRTFRTQMSACRDPADPARCGKASFAPHIGGTAAV